VTRMQSNRRSRIASVVLSALLALAGCSEDEDSTADSGAPEVDAGSDAGSEPTWIGRTEPVDPNDCPRVVSDADCDTTQRPIVFVHGTYGSGDNIAHVAQLFGSNGYCQDRFVAVDYNSLGLDPLEQLDALIDEVRERTGLEQVDIMGHSQGAGHCYDYLEDAAHAAKVAHYVHLAGGARNAPPGGVATLSLASESDTLLGADGVAGAEETVVFDDQDHFAVASSTDSFVAIYKYLIGGEPEHTNIQCGDDMVTIEGVARTFADNEPVVGGRLDIFELGSTGTRTRGEPVATLEGDENGRSPAIELKRGVQYEFIGYDAQGTVIGHQYFAPFVRSNRLLRFLSPSSNALAAIPTNNVVTDAAHTAFVLRSFQGAFRKDLGDTLTVGGSEVLQDAFADKASATVGLFLFDANKNGTTDLGSLASYGFTPFVKGTDVYVSAEEPALVEIEFDGHTMRVPNWPSDTEGLTLLVFP
jgi:pimeloyl-ACP methyl ester carboxylesterase